MAVTYDGLTFERLGHASVRIEDDEGTVIYIDPWSEAIDGNPGDGHLVIVTHDDRDHFSVDGIRAVAGDDATIALYEAIDGADIEGDTVSLPLDGTVSAQGIEIRTMPAYNDPEGEHVGEDGSPFHAEGEVIGVCITLGGTTVFYPSDTDFLDHHEGVRADVFIPPIGGHYTMDRHEAADFARSVRPALVLPIHYDTFEAIETDAESFAAELDADGIEVQLF